VQLGFPIDVAERGPGLGPSGARLRIHKHPPHSGEIDHQRAVGHRQPGDIVPTAPDRERDVVLAHKSQARDDVGSSDTVHNRRGTAVDHCVPYLTRIFVNGAAGLQNQTADGLLELLGGVRVETWHSRAPPD
jgi:hypothetical protein